MKKFAQNKYLQVAGVFLVLAILAVMVTITQDISPFRRGEGSDFDSNVFTVVAMMMKQGYMPYLDSFDHKGPLMYILYYVGYMLHGVSGIWVLETGSLFLTLVLIYNTARLNAGKLASLVFTLAPVTVMRTFLQSYITEESAMLFIALTLYLFLDYLIHEKKVWYRKALVGLSFAAVCLLRVNMIAVWIAFCFVILVALIRKKEWKELGSWILWFVIGALVLFAPVLVWLYRGGALQACFEDYILFNLEYSSTSASALMKFWRGFMAFVVPYTFISIGLLLVIFLVVRRKEERFLYGIYLFAYVCTVFFMNLSGKETAHYGAIMIPLMAFPLAAFYAHVKEKMPEESWISAKVLMLCFVGLLSFSALNSIYRLDVEKISFGKGENLDGELAMIRTIIQENTEEDDPISIWGNWDWMYVISNRIHATTYSYQYPIVTTNPEIKEEYFAELEEELPKLILVRTADELADEEMVAFCEENGYTLAWSGNVADIYLKDTEE